MGTSVAREKQAFIEFVLARQWQREQIKHDDEITLDQMVTYYRRHQDEFARPLRAKWEELLVRFAKYPNETAAWEAIARMGNQVLAGVPFADVARTGSDGVEAAKGGRQTGPPRGVLCRNSTSHCSACPSDNSAPLSRAPSVFTSFA